MSGKSMDSEKTHVNEASEAKQLDHLSFTFTVADFILNKNFSTQKTTSQRSAESRVFPLGTPVSSNRETRQGGLVILGFH